MESKRLENLLPVFIVVGGAIGKALVTLLISQPRDNLPQVSEQTAPTPIVSSWGYDTNRINNPEIVCLDTPNYDLNRINNSEFRKRDTQRYSGMAHL